MSEQSNTATILMQRSAAYGPRSGADLQRDWIQPAKVQFHLFFFQGCTNSLSLIQSHPQFANGLPICSRQLLLPTWKTAVLPQHSLCSVSLEQPKGNGTRWVSKFLVMKKPLAQVDSVVHSPTSYFQRHLMSAYEGEYRDLETQASRCVWL